MQSLPQKFLRLASEMYVLASQERTQHVDDLDLLKGAGKIIFPKGDYPYCRENTRHPKQNQVDGSPSRRSNTKPPFKWATKQGDTQQQPAHCDMQEAPCKRTRINSQAQQKLEGYAKTSWRNHYRPMVLFFSVVSLQQNQKSQIEIGGQKCVVFYFCIYLLQHFLVNKGAS